MTDKDSSVLLEETSAVNGAQVPGIDSDIISSISELTSQLMSLGRDGADVNSSKSSPEEYLEFKIKTKKLLEHLFNKLDENRLYERSLEDKVDVLSAELRKKDDKLARLTKYIEEYLQKCTIEAESKYSKLARELEAERAEKQAVERIVLQLTTENRKLRDEISILRMADGSKNDTMASSAHMTDLVYENEDLKEKTSKLEKDLTNLKLQREAEMASIIDVMREFEKALHRNKSSQR